MKKRIAFFLALIMIASIFSGCKSAPETTPATMQTEDSNETVDATDKVIDDIDLGGMTVTMGDWWSPPVYEEEAPASAWDQMVLDYRHNLESTMNFTYNQIGLQNTGEYGEVLVNNFIAGDPICDIFWAKPEMVIPMASQGLLYDLSTLDAFDLTEEKWTEEITDFYTLNGAVYAARPDVDEPRVGVFFNKRLFEQAGIDPELPYDLQASGEWTWEAFEELCVKMTQDLDNDGITDIFALSDNPGANMQMGIYSNGGRFVKKDEEGKFTDGTQDAQFLEGLQWAVSLYSKHYVSMKKEGDSWDHYYADFTEGRTAMLAAEYWVTNAYLKNMGDEFGYVMMPAGPKGHMGTLMYPTPICIPACLDKETANKVAAAYDAWTDQYVRIENAEMLNPSFRDIYYGSFCDSRAVNETVTEMVTNPECQFYDYCQIIPNFDYNSYFWDVAKLNVTPAEQIEALRSINTAAIDAANEKFMN